jgi:hypothetical protein
VFTEFVLYTCCLSCDDMLSVSNIHYCAGVLQKSVYRVQHEEGEAHLLIELI